MKLRLQRILSVLCILAMVLGCLSLPALAEEELETRVITIEWKDENNYDALRPASVTASLAGQSVTLSDANAWVAELSAPAGAEWLLPEVAGYTVSTRGADVTSVIYRHTVRKTVMTGSVSWEDNGNASGLRPASVQLRLLADGVPFGAPVTVSDKNAWTATWENLPVTQSGKSDPIAYAVQQATVPDGYAASASANVVTNRLLTGSLVLSATVSGVPEGADVGNLSLTVTGPDPRFPQTLTLAQVGASYDFGQVLPGAYLVQENNASTLIEGYVMDPANSQVGDAVFVKAGESATLSFRYAWREPQAEEPNPDPMTQVGSLTFQILGPDSRMPMTVTYSQFVNGVFELDGLVPGEYTVVERNAESLINAYTLTSDSVTGLSIRVGKEGAVAALFNHYVPALTPEPEAEFIDIPVTKTWNDNNNVDGNRPDSITVRLFADGVEVDSHVMTAEESWAYTFMDKPRTKEDGVTEIVYTVGEDPVDWYAPIINGYNIVNDYRPQLTSVSVSKVWNDVATQEYRPTSLAVILQPVGTVYVLSDANGWAVTASNLPTRIKGQPVQYSWTEQQTVGYVTDNVEVQGTHTTFTNRLTRMPEIPVTMKQPKTPGTSWTIFEEYDTALGMEIMINHVGDCFD